MFFIYRIFISPIIHSLGIFPDSGCRFTPTCGRYVELAVKKYGIITGLWLGIKRILHCHPFAKGGIDNIV